MMDGRGVVSHLSGLQKIYRVDLTEAEQSHLQELISKGKASGKASARKITRARIVLLVHQGKSDAAIGEALHSGRATVERTRKRFVEEGLEACLKERPRPGQKPKNVFAKYFEQVKQARAGNVGRLKVLCKPL